MYADNRHTHTARILIVDDDEGIRTLLGVLLEVHGYDVEQAEDVPSARRLLREQHVDLVLTDMAMPGDTGLELIRYIEAARPDVASVMITGREDASLAAAALRGGAYGYVVKPFTETDVIVNVMNALRRRDLERANRKHREELELMVKERTNELWVALASLEESKEAVKRAQQETVRRLSVAAEFRDNETARHIERMSRYCGLLASLSGQSSDTVSMIQLASVMHDIGKLGIPDQILRKPGPLTPEERTVMQYHPIYGYRILCTSSSDLLVTAATIAFTHHERVDGKGYPRKAHGDNIPLMGRIAAIADVFDALTSDRVYRKAYPLDEARTIMEEGRGTQFDAGLLDHFLGAMDQVMVIKDRATQEAVAVD